MALYRIRQLALIACPLAFLSLSLGLMGITACRPNPTSPSNHTSAPPPTPAWFEDITKKAGIEFVHQVDTSGRLLFSEMMAPGVAFLDFDNDGRLDLYFIHNVQPATNGPAAGTAATNQLYHQEADGRFRNVSVGSGLDVTGQGNGVAAGDLNNDGFPEVLITEYDRLRLFLNQGGSRFVDVTAAAGLTNHLWSVPAAFVDYDRDGWLDLVVGNYLDFDPTQRCVDVRGQPEYCGPQGFRTTITRLFRNVTGESRSPPGGAAGAVPSRQTPRFADVTVAAGLARAPGKAMQILCADFDGDRWPDLFITDDALPNRFFLNRRDGTFTEEAVSRGLAYTGMGVPAANMGIAVGDIDQDGFFDLFVPHLTEENHTLWRQISRGLFQDFTASAGLLNVAWHGTGFGTAFGDFDCDGDLDLSVVNGRIRRPVPGREKAGTARDIPAFWRPYAEPAQLFANDGAGRFSEVSASNSEYCGEAHVGRGLGIGDIDNDGGLDLVAVGISGRARLVRNCAARGHWLGVRVIDPSLGGRDALGAEVVVVAGGKRNWRLAHSASSYASSQDPRVHFGLGTLSRVDAVEVRWPDGTGETFGQAAVDRYVTLQKGAGQKLPP